MNKRKDRRTKAFKQKHRIECASHYSRNKQYYLDRNKRLVAAKRKWLDEYKESRGCSRCRVLLPACALDLHHRDPTIKRDNVSSLVTRGWTTLKSEVEKCDVICANCHRILEH